MNAISLAVLLIRLGCLDLQDKPSLSWTVTQGIPSASAQSVPMPKATVLKKGTLVKLSGRLVTEDSSPLDAQGAVYIRSGSLVRSKGTFTGAWNLDWDTSQERESNVRLSVAVLKPGESALKDIAVCNVTLLESDPLSITIERSSNGGAVAKYSFNPAYAIADPKLLVDGEAVSASFDAAGQASLGPDVFASPNPQAFVQLTATLLQSGKRLGLVSSPVTTTQGSQLLKIVPESLAMTIPDDPFDSQITFRVESPGPVTGLRIATGDDLSPVHFDNGTVTLDPRILPSDDSDMYIRGLINGTQRAFSLRTKMSSIGLTALLSKMEAAKAKERGRLGPWRARLMSLLSSMPSLRLPTDAKARLDVDVEQVIGIFIAEPVVTDGFKQAVSDRFNSYWSRKDFLKKFANLSTHAFTHTLMSADQKKDAGAIKFQMTGLAYDEVHAVLGAHHQKLLTQVRSLGEETARLYVKGLNAIDKLSDPAASQLSFVDRYVIIEQFMIDLNKMELNSYKAAQLINDLSRDIGFSANAYLIKIWVMAPRDASDTGGSSGVYSARDRSLPGRQWWRLPPPDVKNL